MRKQLQFLCSTLLVILAAMTACGPQPTEPPQETDLPFETIERADTPGTGQNYEGKEPKLVIIAEAEEIGTLENMVSTTAQTQVHSLNFGQYLAIAVFQGSKGSGGYGTEIQRVARKGNSITVYAHLTERDPQLAAPDVITSPYHLVKVQKSGIQGEDTFILNVDGKVMSQRTHRVP